MDSIISSLSESTGLAPDMVRMALCLVLSYPLSALIKHVPGSLRSLYILTTASVYTLAIFHLASGLVTLLTAVAFTYVLTWALPRSPFMPWINLLGVMAHLLVTHYREQVLYTGNDFANVIGIGFPQMVMVMRLSSFGWNVADGSRPEAQLSAFQRNRAVHTHPSVTDFLAYTMFFPTLLTGPYCDYNEFARWISELNSARVQARAQAQGIFGGALWHSMIKLGQGLAWVAVWLWLLNRFPAALAEDSPTGPDWQSYSLFSRLWQLVTSGLTLRAKYYGAWLIAEGACIICGLGYNEDSKRWDLMQNVDIWHVEFGQNPHMVVAAWNQNTGKWLKNYVYLRVTPQGQKPGFYSTLATFLTSAVWHGVRPGYYLTFLTGALLQSQGKQFRRHVRPIFLLAYGKTPGPYKLYYDLVGTVFTHLSFDYMGHPFALLDIGLSLTLWSRLYYFVYVGLALSFLSFHGPFRPQVLGYLHSLHPKRQ